MLRICGSAQCPAPRTLGMAGDLRQAHDHKDGPPRSPGARTPEYRALSGNEEPLR